MMMNQIYYMTLGWNVNDCLVAHFLHVKHYLQQLLMSNNILGVVV